MAATYQLLQKDQEAQRLMDGYKLSDSHQELDDFHSELAVDAQYIYLLAKHFESAARKLDGDQILRLTDLIFKGEYNTIASAYSILALGAYSKLVLSNDFNEDISFSVLTADDQKKVLSAALAPFMKADYPAGSKMVQIEGKQGLFYLDLQAGFDNQLPSTATRQGLEILRSFVDDQGNEVSEFTQGKELTVKLRIRALDGKSLNNVAVIDLLPGGFEVVRSSVARSARGWQADYIDIREDRVVYYGSFDSTLRELSYRVKLTAAGDFVVPPSYAESMYDRSIRAISAAGKFKVTASQ
jgi:alpha-2-macroglobulin